MQKLLNSIILLKLGLIVVIIVTFLSGFRLSVAACLVACCFPFYIGNTYDQFANSDRYASLIINAKNGSIIYSRNAHLSRYPASLVKVMTLYILFDEIKKGRLTLNKTIFVSKNAASQPRTNLNMKPGSRIIVKDAILALAVKSANDVAVAVAEKVAGSESKFVDMMNAKARSLKMYNTVFRNASGLPDKRQVTTAYDMGLLALSIQRNHSAFSHLFARTSFKFADRIIKGHNHILKKYHWIDGMKTGYINDSGFNIITTTRRPEGRLIAVVMGGDTASNRDRHTVDLLNAVYKKMSLTARSKINSKSAIITKTKKVSTVKKAINR